MEVERTTLQSGHAKTSSDYLSLKYRTHKVKTTVQYRTITEKDEYKKVKVSTRVKTRDASYDWKAPGDKFTSTNCQRYTGVEEQHGYFVFSTLCADGNDVYVYIPSNGSDINQIESEVGMYQDYPSQMSGAHRLDLNGYTFSYSDSELQEHPATYATKYTWVNKKTGHKIRVYSKSKTVSKTYTVKIGNDGTMTNREYKRIKDSMTVGTVKGIVGAAGSVTSRYSVGGHEYITRSYDPGNVDCDEYSRWKTYTDIRQVFYDNGRVYAKLWT